MVKTAHVFAILALIGLAVIILEKVQAGVLGRLKGSVPFA